MTSTRKLGALVASALLAALSFVLVAPDARADASTLVKNDGFKVLGGGSVRHSDGTNTIVGSQRLFIGNASASSDDSALLVGRSLTGSYSTGAHAVRDETIWTHSGSGLTGYASFDALPKISGATAYNHLRGFQARPEYAGSNVLSELSGMQSQPTNTGSGTVTNLYAYRVDDANGTGAITNQYGVYIPALTRGASNYAIYSASTALPSYHGGRMQFGTVPRISAAGFTTYGSVLSHDTNGDILSNPNLTIINGLLDFHNTTGVAQFWTSGNLKIGIGNNGNTKLRAYVPAAGGYSVSIGGMSSSDGTTYTEHVSIAGDTGTLAAKAITTSGHVSAASLAVTATAPAASNNGCNGVGEIRTDASYIYVCTASNTWKRAALSAF